MYFYYAFCGVNIIINHAAINIMNSPYYFYLSMVLSPRNSAKLGMDNLSFLAKISYKTIYF